MRRRAFLTLSLAGAAGLAGLAAARGRAEDAASALRIGYQKSGVLVIARQQAALERALSGVAVQWVEFPSGPPLLEAMNAGSIDFGAVGDTPPIFAQAAGAAIVYVAVQPITNGLGILVRAEAAIHAPADLVGKRIGVTKGSSAHNLLTVALERAGLGYADVTPVYLAPADAAAAFARGSIDAWSIWDPFLAIGEGNGGRMLIAAPALAKVNSFFIANRAFAARHPVLLRDLVAALGASAGWAQSHPDAVAQALAEVTGVDRDIEAVAARRAVFADGRLTDEVVASQQAIADRFHRLGLIPRPVVVRDAVWTGPQS